MRGGVGVREGGDEERRRGGSQRCPCPRHGGSTSQKRRSARNDPGKKNALGRGRTLRSVQPRRVRGRPGPGRGAQVKEARVASLVLVVVVVRIELVDLVVEEHVAALEDRLLHQVLER